VGRVLDGGEGGVEGGEDGQGGGEGGRGGGGRRDGFSRGRAVGGLDTWVVGSGHRLRRGKCVVLVEGGRGLRRRVRPLTFKIRVQLSRCDVQLIIQHLRHLQWNQSSPSRIR